MEQVKVKRKTVEQALAVLRRHCARMERSEYDVRRSMMRWQMSSDEMEKVVTQLVAERFVDNARYAEAFVRDKLRFSGWGRRKIVNALRVKQISPQIIASLDSMFESEDEGEKLSELLEKKARQVKAKNRYDLRDKLIRFGLYRGFDLDELLHIAAKISVTKFSEDNSED